MARIAAGTVTLHDARRKVRWSVDLEPFEIGVYPVTQEQLAELLGETASHPRRPATDVSWLRAIRFCNAASEWEGLDPAYTFEGEDVTWHVDADGYRLPTEAEWEYACRAGSTGPHYGPLAEVAWTSADGVTTPQNVGGQAAEPQRTVRHPRERMGVVLGSARSRPLRRVPRVPRRRVRRRRLERPGVDPAGRCAAHAPRGRRVPRRARRLRCDGCRAGLVGGEADRERAAIDGPLPPGGRPAADGSGAPAVFRRGFSPRPILGAGCT